MATLSSSPQSNSHPITTNSYNSEPSNPRCVFLSVECGCYLHCELRRRVIVGVGIWLLVRLWDNIFLYISAPTLLALFLHTHFYSLTCLYCNSPASGPHFPHLFCFVFFSLFSFYFRLLLRMLTCSPANNQDDKEERCFMTRGVHAGFLNLWLWDLISCGRWV